MNRSFLIAVFTALLPFKLISSEPSAFGAGDLTNPQPYGLTPNEEVILENKKKLHTVVVKSNNQANEVDSLRARIDGLQSIVESLSEKSQENKSNINKLESINIDTLKKSDEYEKRLSTITQINSEVSKNNTDNIEKIKVVMGELSSLIDSINQTYVSKNEFNNLVNDVNNFKDLVAKELKEDSSQKSTSQSEFDGMSKGDIATKAKSLYNSKKYTKAIEYYTYLIDNNYKPAYSHYMIAEMYYYRKNYSDAIAYFKKSAALYSKASYMPILMLHTAVAMEKTGDKKNAEAFYSGIIAKYPDSKYAKDAKKYLSLMKK